MSCYVTTRDTVAEIKSLDFYELSVWPIKFWSMFYFST